MRKRSHFLAAFFGALTAAAVWSWPAGPLWQSEAGVGRNFGFSPDGSVVVTAGFWSDDVKHVTRWDAATGRLLSRAIMQCDPPRDDLDLCTIRPSPDGTLVLVGQGVRPKDDSGIQFWTGDWFVHDGVTGRRILGPIEGLNHVGLEQISPDGRWLAGYRGEARSGVRHSDRLSIYSTETGKSVVEFGPEPGKEGFCRFATDSKSVAVWWMRKSNDAGKHAIVLQIVELPSSHQRKRVEFPPQSWNGISQWDGRFLKTIKVTSDVKSGKLVRCQLVFDLGHDTLGPGVADSLLRDFTDDIGRQVHWSPQSGTDWGAQLFFVKADDRRPGIAGWFDWLRARSDLGRDSPKRIPVMVRMIDRPTGKIRYELPRPVSLSLYFSANGKRLACGEDSIEVWDTDPPSRWFIALGWGLLVAGTIVAWARWRQRRATKPPAISALPNGKC